MKSLLLILRFIFSHPLTRGNKVSACFRLLKWQIGSRVFPFPVLWPFVEGTRLVVTRGMSGATGNIYAGLHEFEEMGFLLHVLRPDDLFGDIGANVGSYSILASGVAGSHSIGVEPVLSTFMNYKHNVAVNDLDAKIGLHHSGVGASSGKLYFTRDQDTVNHVVPEGTSVAEETEEVDITTLDQLFADRAPVLLKIDVEGYESSVLQGAKTLLRHPALRCIIIEINGACNRYGVREEEIHQSLLSYNFEPVSYAPFDRKLTSAKSFNPNGNTIYIRDRKWVEERVLNAKRIRVLNKSI